MINIDLLREQPDLFRASLTNRFKSTDLVDEIITADQAWRQLLTKIEALRQERNNLATSAASAKDNQARLKEIKPELADLEEREPVAAQTRDQLLSRLPNLLDPSVPVGAGESANTVVKTAGTISRKDGLSHEELMTKLDWLDVTTAATVSGARFRYLKGQAALAWMKLSRLAFEFAVESGFTPVIPPVIVRGDTLAKGGFFPEGEEDTFKVGDDMYLIGTSEYALVALAGKKTYTPSDLPQRLVGFSTCFRKEAGSYGKDVRGIFRQHQFDKVEMVSICAPDQSEAEHKFLLSMQEKFISQFNLPYQVVLIGSGDVEKKATKRFDIETWFPGQKQYRETHSVSNCTDFQARSLGIKAANTDGQTEFAHTLNGTLVTERLLLAMVENGQTDGGQVKWPAKLKV